MKVYWFKVQNFHGLLMDFHGFELNEVLMGSRFSCPLNALWIWKYSLTMESFGSFHQFFMSFELPIPLWAAQVFHGVDKGQGEP